MSLYSEKFNRRVKHRVLANLNEQFDRLSKSNNPRYQRKAEKRLRQIRTLETELRQLELPR